MKKNQENEEELFQQAVIFFSLGSLYFVTVSIYNKYLLNIM